MEISSIRPVHGNSDIVKSKTLVSNESRKDTFEAVFQSALNLVKETDAYTKAAEQEEMAYAMGLTNSTHDLQIAQAKASISLQYTVAVRNAVLDAYKEIMQLQF